MAMTTATSTLLMTGGSSGIGRKAAVCLLREYPDHHLLLLVRGGRAERIAAELAAEAGSDHVSAVQCDLASLTAIRGAAEEVLRLLDAEEIPPLHVILGNAGVQTASATKTTVDGFEMTFGVNVLANYTLLRLLSPKLVPPARIVIVGSDVHFADFRHNLGTWFPSRTGRARTSWPCRALRLVPIRPGRASERLPQASSACSTSCTPSHVAFPPASTSTPTTRAGSRAPDWVGRRAQPPERWRERLSPLCA
jgi:NAD(P)-dependent dehydrogenase (short-subunit alcohol dehydrogenase family)